MKKMISLISICLMITGCASYSTTSLVFREQAVEEGDFKVIMEQYYDVQKSEELFDENLQKKKVFTLAVNINNYGNNKWLLKPSDILITDNMGNTLTYISPIEGKEAVKESMGGYAAGNFLLFGIIGAGISAAHTDSVNKKIEADVARKVLLEENTILAKEGLQGVAFFRTPDYPSGTHNFSTKVKLVNLDTNEIKEFSKDFTVEVQRVRKSSTRQKDKSVTTKTASSYVEEVQQERDEERRSMMRGRRH